MERWADLFERAADFAVNSEELREAIEEREESDG